MENAAVEDEVASSPSKRKRQQPTLADVFGLQVENNGMLKDYQEQQRLINERIENVDARLAVVEAANVGVLAKVDSFESRLVGIEKASQSTSEARQSSPERTQGMMILVVGTRSEFGRARPEATVVSQILGIPEDIQKVTHPGSAVVEVMGNQEQFLIWNHKSQQTRLWIAERRSPVQQRAWNEWNSIKKWFAQLPDSEQWSIDVRRRCVKTKAELVAVHMAAKNDRVIWVDEQLRLRWLGRQEVQAQPVPKPAQPEPTVQETPAGPSGQSCE